MSHVLCSKLHNLHMPIALKTVCIHNNNFLRTIAIAISAHVYNNLTGVGKMGGNIGIRLIFAVNVGDEFARGVSGLFPERTKACWYR